MITFADWLFLAAEMSRRLVLRHGASRLLAQSVECDRSFEQSRGVSQPFRRAIAFFALLGTTLSVVGQNDASNHDHLSQPLSNNLAEAGWPQFRGPNCQGVAENAKPPIQFGPDNAMLWKTRLPSGVSSPCIWNDRIFVTGFDPDRNKLETLCLNATNGEILWRNDAPEQDLEKVHDASSPANTSPATDGRRLYVHFPMFGVIAYWMDGRVAWAHPLSPSKMFFGYGSSPVVVEGKVIVRVSAESQMLALRCNDGETVWKSAESDFGWGYATPVTWKEGGRTALGVRSTGRFDVLDVETGATLWGIKDTPLSACATPAVNDDMIYLSGTGVFGNRELLTAPPEFDELVARYDSNKDGRIALSELPESILIIDRGVSSKLGNRTWKEELTDGPTSAQKSFDKAEWTRVTREILQKYHTSDAMKTAVFAVRTGGRSNATNNIVWSEVKGVPEVPSPLLYRKRLYYIKNGGIMTCRDPATGKAIYEERVGAEGGYFASPVAADGKIYVASDRGVVSVLQAGEIFKVLSQTDLKEAIIATPAIVSDRLYVRSAQHFWAFGSHNHAVDHLTAPSREEQ